MTERVFTGWGLTPRSRSRVVEWSEGPLPWPEPAGRGLLARGLGRSYGDAALNGGGTLVLPPTERAGDRALVPDEAGEVELAAGSSLAAVQRAVVPLGWTVPVQPGTRQVTVGGMVACDVHGKNHLRDGTFGDHVASLVLDAPATGATEVFPGDDAFDATFGGMGLTGIVRSVRLRLAPVESSSMQVDTRRCADLDELLAGLDDAAATHRYAAAWLDVSIGGSRAGRGVIGAADHAAAADGPGRADAIDPAPRFCIPGHLPPGLFNSSTVAAANEAWYRCSPRAARDEPRTMAAFLQPLDGVGGWNRLYGSRGLVQHQSVVPDDAVEALGEMVGVLTGARAPVPLAVLKRFGPEARGHLSFPLAGWTLALDLPASPRWAPVLDRLDDVVASAGGRVYLAKDARMARRHVAGMYPGLDAWREVRDRLDPDGLLQSDLDRRLDLSGRWL